MKHVSRRSFLAGSVLLVACRTPTPAIADDGDDHDDAAVCEPTADNIEGPFFKDGAPGRRVLVKDGDRGTRLALGGLVLGAGCAPLVGAVMEIWHADHRGDYDNDGYRFRGRLKSDADGRWAVSTIVPGRYLNGRRYRPSHIHVKLAADGHRPLTTQLYFEGDPYIEGDPFVVSSLIMPIAKHDGGVRCAFDFVLERA